MTADERLLSARKPIWSSQLHNLKAQVAAVRDRMGSTPEELRRGLVMNMHKLKEAEQLLNEVEYNLDSELREALRHSAKNDTVICAK